MRHSYLGLFSLSTLALFATIGCSDSADDAGLDADGVSCTVQELDNGKVRVSCPDGTEVTLDNKEGKAGAPGRDGDKGRDGDRGRDGLDGAPGKDGQDGKDSESPCSVATNADGTHTLVCGDESVVIGAACDDGFPSDVRVTADPDDGLTFTLFQVTSCTWVRGDLVVEGYGGAELPAALSRIEKVDGEVRIRENDNLEKVSLPRLVEIGGELSFDGNPSLTETGEFPELITAGSLTWRENDALETIGAFPKLEGAYELVWEKNPLLVETPAFPKLEAHTLRWTSNDSLQTIGGFPRLIGGFLIWEDNPLLEAIGSFPILQRAHEIHVINNASLLSLDGLEQLTELYELTMKENNALESIEGLSSLTKVDISFVISHNPALSTCKVSELLDRVHVVYGPADTAGNGPC